MLTIVSLTITERYGITIDKYQYTVTRSRAHNSTEWRYDVVGGTWLRSHHCDPDKATHKRVVKALEAALVASQSPAHAGKAGTLASLPLSSKTALASL